MTGKATGEDGTLDTTGDSDMNATFGLGSDVTILIADDTGTNKGLSVNDPNFKQNIAKIKEVTGLEVTDAIDETTIGGASQTGADAGEGIRLSPGKANGGLVLQIGDTSDAFNQLRVSVKDMHAKAMGISDIDVSTQTGASSAIDRSEERRVGKECRL